MASLLDKGDILPPDVLGTKCTEKEVRRFITDCMAKIGTAHENASLLADVLTEADKRGHFSHGLQRIDLYVRDVVKELCDPNAKPTILKESSSTALVDGNNGLGPVVANFCMKLAIKKAKETGIGWVSNKGSNHYGIAGMWSMMALKEGLIGMSFTNATKLIVPTRSTTPTLGSNPISVAAPAKDGDYVLDMATSVVALGKVEMKVHERKPLPDNWCYDSAGRPTNDAKAGLNGSLLPLGGAEENSGYKGFGLGILVELFCGIMSGGAYGPNIRDWRNPDCPADLSHCFVAIDPSCFAPNFSDRMGDLLNYCRRLTPVDPEKPVLVAGDPERIHIKKVESEGGITYHINVMKEMWKLAKYLGVKPIQAV